MPAHRIPIPESILERYAAGESALALSREFGCADVVIRNRARERGLTVRGRNDYPAHVAAAHAARRGQVDTLESKIARARTREARMLHTSHHEDAMSVVLDAAGIAYLRQRAIGHYNVDFALTELGVVLEIKGGGYRVEKQRQAAARRAFIEGEGWRFVEVKPPIGAHLLSHLS